MPETARTGNARSSLQSCQVASSGARAWRAGRSDVGDSLRVKLNRPSPAWPPPGAPRIHIDNQQGPGRRISLGPVGVSQPSMDDALAPVPPSPSPKTTPHSPLTDEPHRHHTSFIACSQPARHVSSRLLTHVPRPSGVISHHQASSGVRPDGVAISRRAAAPTAAAIPTISTATAAFSSAAANAIACRSGVRLRHCDGPGA